MTGAIILYDQLHPTGAFCKKSAIDIKSCITELKAFQADSTDGLLNALRFTTVHLNDPETPNSIKQLLE
jgi:CYRIA/CYRIB Rac1 binding domain